MPNCCRKTFERAGTMLRRCLCNDLIYLIMYLSMYLLMYLSMYLLMYLLMYELHRYIFVPDGEKRVIYMNFGGRVINFSK
jgi:hypothetical protein